MPPATHDHSLTLAQTTGLMRARELALLGIAGATLQQLLRSGALLRLSRGVYATPSVAQAGDSALLAVAIRCPNAVFCLLTALQLHGLTTQLPHQLWIAIAPTARPPKVDGAALRVLRFARLEHGVEIKKLEGGESVRVTSVARTVADCFKYRNKIGLDIALEALRDAWQQKKVTMDSLWDSAQVCRVANVMRPYMESLIRF
jgi:predicted transcriptional regulator of viral defense system